MSRATADADDALLAMWLRFLDTMPLELARDGEERFLVSTQPGQRDQKHAFYPDAVAQIFPLWIGYPVPGVDDRQWYRRWRQAHREEWLLQAQTDFAWGMMAIIAWKQGDSGSARCWLRRTADYRHGVHWTVTDEVVAQVLAARGVTPAAEGGPC